MKARALKRIVGAIITVVVMVVAVVAAQATAADTASDGATGTSTSKKETRGKVLKIGWSQDVQTLNPFTGLDVENWTIWAINWDMLLNFSPEDLSPAPGVAESWKVSKDQKTVTFKLADRKFSDGTPITSADVKWTLDELGSKGALFTSYTENITSIETPDKKTVIIHTSRPDARIVGGLVLFILPKHIWGKVPADKLDTSYQPDIPLVGSGPFIVTEFQRGKIIRMTRNPEFTDPLSPGKKPKFDEIDLVTYGNQDAVERALQVGEVDLITDVQATTFKRLGERGNIETLKSEAPSFTQLAFNLCSKEVCPDAKVNPAIQDRAVRQAIAFAVDRNRINQIAGAGTRFVANGVLPPFYKSFYQTPKQTYGFDPDRANQILDDAGYVRGSDGIRVKDGNRLSFNMYTRTQSEAPFDAEAGPLVAEMTKKVGIEMKPQPVSVDNLTAVTANTVDGKPAPEFDTFIWGWAGDAYDPSFLLSVLTTGQIGSSSDSFYSNPTYDRLFRQQAGSFDVPLRKKIITRMVDALQRDLPYLVLTDDPVLEAWRTDRVKNVTPVCPDDGGDAICLQTGYEPLLDLDVAGGSSGGGVSPAVFVIIGVVILAGAGFMIVRTRRRAGEALEVEEEPSEEDEE